jgi:hypothetical protein
MPPFCIPFPFFSNRSYFVQHISAGGNKNHSYTSWQQAVVTGRDGSGLPGGQSGGDWSKGGQWGAANAALAAIDEWINAPPKVAACRPFGWKPGNQ